MTIIPIPMKVPGVKVLTSTDIEPNSDVTTLKERFSIMKSTTTEKRTNSFVTPISVPHPATKVSYEIGDIPIGNVKLSPLSFHCH